MFNQLLMLVDPNAPAGIGGWIGTNWSNILAAIGALYVAARATVVLTPTTKDDAVVNQVGGWLSVIGTLFGLDLGQGIRK